ncbi:MAG: AsmA-like C-terminal region-containing protein [Chitinophagaceae bacterium]
MKKFLKITGFTLLGLILLAFLIPILFKKQITELVKKEINKSLTARVDFAEVNLSLFRHFPQVSIQVAGLSVVGTGVFEKDTLLSADNFDASANLFSIIRGDNIKVKAIYLDAPRIHAIVLADGRANWDIVKETVEADSVETDTSASAFHLNLKKYEINDGYISYKDASSGMSAEIEGLDHSGSGDLTADVFTLATRTRADEVSFTYAGVPYLTQTAADITTDIQIDNSKQVYAFDTEDIQLNNLKLSGKGNLGIINDSTYSMDIQFKTPSNEFRDILSMIPAIYRTDFDKIETSGTAAFEGWVKGRYSPVELPAYDVKLAIADGSFRYPDLPKQVKNIQIDLHASNPDGVMDHTEINLSKGHLEMDQEPFDFRFLFRQPETVQYLDAALKGQLDLAQIAQFVKLDPGTELAGRLNADAYAKGSLAAIQQQAGEFTAGGLVNIAGLVYKATDFPQAIRNGNLDIKLRNEGGQADNTVIEVQQGHIELGPDPFDFNLLLTRPISNPTFQGAARGRFTLDNLQQFVSFEPGTSLSGVLNADLNFAGNMADIDRGAYDQVKTSGSAELTQVKYVAPEYKGGINIPGLAAQFNPGQIRISEFNGNYLGSNFSGNGQLDNAIGYAVNNEPLRGTMALNVDRMNLNEWMGTEPVAASETTSNTGTAASSAPFVVPANLDLLLQANAGEVTYDKVSYKNIRGALLLKDQTVKLQNVAANALQGTMTFNGSYSTLNDKKNPEIALSYDLKDIDIQQAFLSFNTAKMLMPIGQFLSGKLQSQLTMIGNLNGNMMPDFSSLTGKGNLLLLEGVLQKFAPLEKLASTLQIAELQSITIKDIRNSFEFANGKVLVKPFTVKVKDIEMEIGGMHGFDQTMEYVIAMKVPRKYLGTQGNQLLNNLASAASSKGIPVNLGEVVSLNIKMGGTVTNPSIKTDLKEVAGDAAAELKEQAEEFAKQKIDSTKQALRDTIASVKEQVVDAAREKVANELKDRLLGKKDSSTQKTDSSRKKPEEQIKSTIKGLFNKPKKPAADTTKG